MTAALAEELPRATPGLLRAYVVTDYDEERATVVYASNPMEARRMGHGQDDVGACCAEEELSVERAEYLDDLKGRPLIEAQLAHGWWFGCAHCERRVEGEEEDGDGRPQDPTIRGDDVYCSPWCAGAEAVRHVDARIRVWEALGWVTRAYPGVRVEQVWPDTFGRGCARDRLVATLLLRVPPAFCHVFRVQRGQRMMLTELEAAEWLAFVGVGS